MSPSGGCRSTGRHSRSAQFIVTWPTTCILLLAASVGALVPGTPLKDCDYGAEPGYWDLQKYTLFNSTCKLESIMEKILLLQKRGDDLSTLSSGSVLTIGDSVDRKLISMLTEELGQEPDYYAPFKWKTLPSGRVKPEQTGKSMKVAVGPIQFANFFIFGAGDKQYYDLFYKAAAIHLLHNTTSERICKDAPVFTDPFMPKGPDMLIMATNYWDVARWHEQGFADREEEDLRAQVVDQYVKDIERMMNNAKKCFPHAKTYCWRTHPLTSTDERNRHYVDKRPHVVAALNQAGRLVAARKGWCLLDMERMLSGHANEKLWMPDGLHPSDFVLKEYGNLLLNTLYQANQWKVPHVSGSTLV